MSDLEARIAEVLLEHAYAGMDGQYADRCKCGWAGNGDAQPAKHQAAMLAPVIREREAEAWDACVHAADKQWTIGHTSAQLLRNANPYRSSDE